MFTRLRRAGPVTFVVYVCVTAFSAIPAVAHWSVVHHVLTELSATENALRAEGGAVLLEGAHAWLAARRTLLPSIAAALLAMLLISPLLQMAWLASMERPSTLREAFARGVHKWLDAIEVTLFLLPALLALVMVGGALLVGAHFALAAPQHARAHDVSIAAIVLVWLVPVSAWAVWHDVARTSVAVQGLHGREAVRSALVHLHPRSVFVYVSLWIVGWIVAALGQAASASVDWNSVPLATLLLVVSQLFALTRILTRGSWLAWCVNRVDGVRP